MVEVPRKNQSTGELPRRHILHADLDAFYAAVEQLDNPDLRGKPVLVGGSPEGRGVVATASYEARQFGVHSAMPMRSAVRLCPQGIVVHPRFSRYREFSRRVMDIFQELTSLVEPLSLDEAYLDITAVVEDEDRVPLAVALDLKRRVNEETGLTISIGAATSKSVAKIASDLQKPDGLVVVEPGDERDFLAPLAVGKLWGIGPKTAEKLNKGGVETIGQMAQQSGEWFNRQFGKRAGSIQAKALGLDREEVHTEREAKSVSSENTFSVDLVNPEDLKLELDKLASGVAGHMERKGLTARTVTLKARLADFTTFTRQTTLPAPTCEVAIIQETAWRLLSQELAPERAFRLLGVGVSGFNQPDQPQEFQLPLLEV
ncbi:MAG: hypothetical protein BZY88_07205 [SAR202 cluster bacterium Io17-Chloro-G9]|nr:MAG: hypothetical protein BZY88_07205 [SAR202 cluster bacterium Io17-Chloro-G9]